MEFVIKKPVLSSALHKCGSTVSRRDAVPVLKNFLIQADQEEIRIVGTDLELGLVARIQVVDVKEPGRITAPATKLLSIVDEAEDGDIRIVVNEKSLIDITAGPTQWMIHGMSAEDYPEVPKFDPAQAMTINREKLLSAVRRVRKAASEDEQRLNLMMLRFIQGKVYATDGHRVHMADSPDEFLDMSLPSLAVNELIRLMERSETESIMIQITDNHLLFKIGNEVFSSGKLQAQFPDVEKSIINPTDGNKDLLKIDRTTLLSAVKRVKITSDEKTQAVSLSIDGHLATLTSADESGNQSTEQIPCTWEGGTDSRVVGFNHQYLKDLLEAFTEKVLEFRFGEDKKHRKAPVRVDGEGLTVILLPLRIDAAN